MPMEHHEVLTTGEGGALRLKDRGRWLAAAALLCALLAAVTVAVEPPGQPAGAEPPPPPPSTTEPSEPPTQPPTTEPPAAPSGLRASLADGSVSLNWDDPGDDSIRSYEYRIKTAGAGNVYGNWTRVVNSDASTTSATITVTGSERRIVQLRANGSGASDSAAASTGPPDAPRILGLSPAGSSSGSGQHVTWAAAASAPKGSVTVVWADPGDDSIVKYQYRIKPRPTGPGGGRYSQRIDIPLEDLVRTAATSTKAATLSYTFVLPTPEKYSIMLRAVNNAGVNDMRFNVEPSWPTPAAPTGFRASLDEDENWVSLSWDNPHNEFIKAYEYRIKTAGAGNSYSKWIDITSSVSGRWIDEGGIIVFGGADLSATINVTGTGRRIVQLRALHDVGDPGSPATASTGRPAQAQILGLSPAGSSSGSGQRVTWTAAASAPKGSVTVVWADPGDDSIVKYQYRLKPRATGPSGGRYSLRVDIPLGDLVRTPATPTEAATFSYTFVLPTPEKYRIMLRAVNNEGVRRAVFNVEPSWPAPAAPTGLEASLAGGSLSLSWDNPRNGFIQAYEYRIKTAGAGNSYSAWTDITSSVSGRFIEEGGNLTFRGADLSATIDNVTGTERRVVQLRALHDVGDPGNPATASTG